jgi:hypothetical protein
VQGCDSSGISGKRWRKNFTFSFGETPQVAQRTKSLTVRPERKATG